MAESPTGSSSPLPGNLVNGTLAILTLLGGLYYLKSGPLASDRPVALPGESKHFIGEGVETRLWEDPLKEANRGGGRTVTDPAESLPHFVNSISNLCGPQSCVLLLPVMLEDGQYSEDQESRIRTRSAVVAGLGVRGYVPQDAEHIGRVQIDWPKEGVLAKRVARFKNDKETDLTNLLHDLSPEIVHYLPRSPNDTNLVPVPLDASNVLMDLRYEWFAPREVFPNSAKYVAKTNVLVVWLGEGYFADDPLVRLPLLLYRLGQTNHPGTNCAATNEPAIKLIGPNRSATLRAMLPGQFSTEFADENERLGSSRLNGLTNWLGRIDLFCAAPAAMDAVLVSNATRLPRYAVGRALTGTGFNSFHNFVATDDQIAAEACEELKLRGVDLSQPNNHLVLIAEWDTFYSRMVSLTFQARLATLQHQAIDPRDYVHAYREGIISSAPDNFHRCYYVRGLDGQTVLSDLQLNSRSDAANGSKSKPATTDEFRQWVPDANKAEGPSQLDYVGRLADRLIEMEKNFRTNDHGRIKAIGVVGSDVYDTLIVLQGLRSRFPEAVFFTTDLDARLWHPKELTWSRNLLVLSGYGLTLDDALQHGTPPFRDSGQTALYAATMAALGDTNLLKLAKVPVRRFEIGRHGVVNLSVRSSFASGFQLHPPTTSEIYGSHRFYLRVRACWALVILVILAAAVCFYIKSVKRATWKWSRFLCRSLKYSAEDFGGLDGAAVLRRQLEAHPDHFCQWLYAELKKEFERISKPDFLDKLATLEADLSTDSREHRLQLDEMHGQLADALAMAFNRILKHTPLADPEKFQIRKTSLAAAAGHIDNGAKFICRNTEWETEDFWGRVMKHRRRLAIYQLSRDCLDKLLAGLPDTPCSADALHPPVEAAGVSSTKPRGEIAARLKRAALATGSAARAAGVEIVCLRKKRRRYILPVLLLAAAIGLCLGVSIWLDTMRRPEGQPLSFENGASAWLAQICRFIAITVAACSCITIYYRKRIAFARITREFRFNVDPPKEAPAGRICAAKSWKLYTEKRIWQKRLSDIFLPCACYLFFCFAIFKCAGGDVPFSPIRGSALLFWNSLILPVSVILFLLLTFLTIDTSLRCRSFILRLGAAPTDYPEATRRHFARLNGELDESYLDEWIDVQLIAELTEQIGGMLYYPACVFCLLLIARNEIWAQWSWPLFLVIIFSFNLLLAVASVVIMQIAAKRAKEQALANLRVKVKRLENLAAASKAESNATQAERLLEEINNLHRGAFARVWENPVVGAILLPSSGLTIVQAMIWILGR